MTPAASEAVLEHPAAVAGLIARAQDPKIERWLEQVKRTGRAGIASGSAASSSVASGSSTPRATNPTRAHCPLRQPQGGGCPSCAYEYVRDMWQLVYAGSAGGRKGVPESVAEHPQVFATLTAPSFGPVHNRPDDGRPCRCGRYHPEDDPQLGGPIDPSTYDYEGAVLWNWHAPGLWNRFVVEVVRAIAARAGLGER
jgi:hypothetical protein